MEEGTRPVPSLTEDLIVEILSRIPVKPLFRFKCVSKNWLNLISHPNNRKKLPQTLVGFLYKTRGINVPAFTNVSGKGCPFICPSLTFLPEYLSVTLLDCCNGLLLCRWKGVSSQDEFHYVVCNPATEKWVILPDSSQAGKICTARLGFDPAISSDFHVFEFIEDRDGPLPVFTGLELYSSKTGGWVRKENLWNDDLVLAFTESATVFLNNCLHFLTLEPAVAAVDTEGNTCRNIPLPSGWTYNGSILKSHGRLHCEEFHGVDGVSVLQVYVLEDYDSNKWTLKHSLPSSYISERTHMDIMYFELVAIHPDRNLIFFTVGWDRTLMSYDMDHPEVKVLCNLGHDAGPLYLPYVPLYSESQALDT